MLWHFDVSNSFQNWNQLLKHFNELENCIENEVDLDVPKQDDPISDIVTVNTIISISSPDIHGFPSIQGNLILDGILFITKKIAI